MKDADFLGDTEANKASPFAALQDLGGPVSWMIKWTMAIFGDLSKPSLTPHFTALSATSAGRYRHRVSAFRNHRFYNLKFPI